MGWTPHDLPITLTTSPSCQFNAVRSLVCADPVTLLGVLQSKALTLLSVYNDLKDGRVTGTAIAVTLAKTIAPVIGIIVTQYLSRSNPAGLIAVGAYCASTATDALEANACTVGE